MKMSRSSFSALVQKVEYGVILSDGVLILDRVCGERFRCARSIKWCVMKVHSHPDAPVYHHGPSRFVVRLQVSDLTFIISQPSALLLFTAFFLRCSLPFCLFVFNRTHVNGIYLNVRRTL